MQLLPLHPGPVPVLTLARPCSGPQTPGLQVSCVCTVPASNSSLCTLVQFQFSLWPDHVRDLKLQAYRYLVCMVPTSNSAFCTLVQFQFSLWPDHVRDLKLQVYRYLVCMSIPAIPSSALWSSSSSHSGQTMYGTSNSRPTGTLCVWYLLATAPSAL